MSKRWLLTTLAAKGPNDDDLTNETKKKMSVQIYLHVLYEEKSLDYARKKLDSVIFSY